MFVAESIRSNGFPDNGKPILNGISLTIRSGEWWQIVGESGVGKTLFLRCLAGLIPSQGKLLLHNRSITDYPLPEWRRHVLFIGSKPIPFADTIQDTMTLPFHWRHLSAPDNDHLRRTLHSVGLTFAMDYSTKSLSDGERVRLAIASAILLAPDILLLDESLAPLDRSNADLVISTILSLSTQQGTGIIWVDHGDRLTSDHPISKLEIKKNER